MRTLSPSVAPLDILPLLLVPTDDVPSLVPTTAAPSHHPLFLCVRLNNHMSALRPPLRAAGHAIMEFFPELKKLLGPSLRKNKRGERVSEEKTSSVSAAAYPGPGRHLLCLLSSVILLQRPTTLELKRILSRGASEEKEEEEEGKLCSST